MTIPPSRIVEQTFHACVLNTTWLRETNMLKSRNCRPLLCGRPDGLGERMAALAWLRRLVVSMGIGGTSYAIMLGIMVLSIVYDRELEPVITLAFDAGRGITNTFDSMVSGSHWGQVAV